MKRSDAKLVEERKKLQDLCKAYALLRKHGVRFYVDYGFVLYTKAELVEWCADRDAFVRRRIRE